MTAGEKGIIALALFLLCLLGGCICDYKYGRVEVSKKNVIGAEFTPEHNKVRTSISTDAKGHVHSRTYTQHVSAKYVFVFSDGEKLETTAEFYYKYERGIDVQVSWITGRWTGIQYGKKVDFIVKG